MPLSHKLSRHVLAFCLCLGWFHPAPLHAQQVSNPQTTAPALVTGNYEFKGSAIWQQPDGTTLHGTVTLYLDVTIQADGSPAIDTDANFTFLNPASSSPFTYNYVGKMNADKTGNLRVNAVSGSGTNGGTTVIADPALEATKLPILLNQKLTAVSGGTLTPDGTQLTFRTTFIKLRQ